MRAFSGRVKPQRRLHNATAQSLRSVLPSYQACTLRHMSRTLSATARSTGHPWSAPRLQVPRTREQRSSVAGTSPPPHPPAANHSTRTRWRAIRRGGRARPAGVGSGSGCGGARRGRKGKHARAGDVGAEGKEALRQLPAGLEARSLRLGRERPGCWRLLTCQLTSTP